MAAHPDGIHDTSRRSPLLGGGGGETAGPDPELAHLYEKLVVSADPNAHLEAMVVFRKSLANGGLRVCLYRCI